MRPTRAGRLMAVVIVLPPHAPKEPSASAGCGLPRCPASLRIGGTSGAETNVAHPSSSQSNSAQTRFSSVGSRNTVEPFEPWRARLSAPFVPNTSRNRSTFSTVVVARIMTAPFRNGSLRIPLAADVVLDGPARRLGTVGDAELRVDVLDVVLGGP